MPSCFNHVQLFATPWTVAHQAPLSMVLSRQEYWSGLPFPSPGDLPNPKIISLMSPALAGGSFPLVPLGIPACTPFMLNFPRQSSKTRSYICFVECKEPFFVFLLSISLAHYFMIILSAPWPSTDYPNFRLLCLPDLETGAFYFAHRFNLTPFFLVSLFT